MKILMIEHSDPDRLRQTLGLTEKDEVLVISDEPYYRENDITGFKPELIVCGLALPDLMSGRTVLRKVLSLEVAAVVVVSAYLDDSGLLEDYACLPGVLAAYSKTECPSLTEILATA